MIVRRSNFQAVLEVLKTIKTLGADTETTGLRPHHGDRLFSIILAHRVDRGSGAAREFYFNFQPYAGLDPEFVLTRQHLKELETQLFDDPFRVWDFHNAPFDLAMLENEGIDVKGVVHCTAALARVQYNDHMGYSLADCAKRIGLAKDTGVEEYISEHNLWEWQMIPGKKVRRKNMFFSKVPFNVISGYGCMDARIAAALGEDQRGEFMKLSKETPEGLPTLDQLAYQENRLTRTVVRMERQGILADLPYCIKASSYEEMRSMTALSYFKKETGHDFKASPKLFAKIFESDKEHWAFTEKGNPSFDSDTLKKFKNPAAGFILDYRDAKSKRDFYEGFIYHADSRGYVHPHFNPGATGSGRLSSSDPNFQNLTAEDVIICLSCKKGSDVLVATCSKCGSTDFERPEFLTRRAIIPAPGHVFFLPDYDQMEYKMMLDYACRIVGYLTDIAKKVVEGSDVHQAMADTILAKSGRDIGRSHAKNCNFAKLYGAGVRKLALMIGCSIDEARAIMRAMDEGVPEIATFVADVIKTAEQRGFVRNWAGRRSYFKDPRLAYKAPNYLIQGGCADVTKKAMNGIDQLLLHTQSKMVATIHDELPIQVHESEIHTVPKNVIEIMERAYPFKFVPLTAGAEWSERSLADKRKGYPA